MTVNLQLPQVGVRLATRNAEVVDGGRALLAALFQHVDEFLLKANFIPRIGWKSAFLR